MKTTRTAHCTIMEGRMSPHYIRQLSSIAEQLRLTDAKAIEWALDRCGLRIKIPLKISPQ